MDIHSMAKDVDEFFHRTDEDFFLIV